MGMGRGGIRSGHALLRFAVPVAFALGFSVAIAAVADEFAVPPDARQRELIRLLKHDCGACHGLRLTGGLGPALTPDALKDKRAENLVATIISGRPGTAMPPWRPYLSDAEAQWLVARMREGVSNAH
jgi:cytochrome c55X